MKNIIMVGGSGLLGTNILSILSEKKDITVTSLVRKKDEETKFSSINEVLFNFDDENEYKKIGSEIPCHIFICCLGTTIRKAKSFESFIKVDKDYPIKFLDYLKKNSPNALFVFTSSIGVSNPRGYYLTAKSEVEKAITKSLIHYIIVRPSILLGKRKELRIAETIGGLVLNKVDNFFKKLNFSEEFSFSKYAPIEAKQVAQTMVYHSLNFDRSLPGMILEGESLKFNESEKKDN